MAQQSDLFDAAPLAGTSGANLAHMEWTATREAGLARLNAFAPRAGGLYAHSRNTDFGPTDRSNVSALSPYLARRMITEQEVVETVQRHHSFHAAQKFTQEVFWRTYWKGWLEMRPNVLVAFNQQRIALKGHIAADPDLARRIANAMAGETGIACFDAWVGELRDYGWLHNHARMWFASIWIFTLELPWQIGADFFYKHLLDADAASNTLSWRWVAGLHTKGKHYLARASNIVTHTDSRFDPHGQLDESALPLNEAYQVPGPILIPAVPEVQAEKVGLLITQEDMHPTSLDIRAKVIGAAALSLPEIGPIDSARNLFSRAAMADARDRASQDFGVDSVNVSECDEIAAWAKNLGISEIVTGYAPVGLVSWRLTEISAQLASHGLKLTQVRRRWDSLTWPLATGGFFKLKDKLPHLVQELTRR